MPKKKYKNDLDLDQVLKFIEIFKDVKMDDKNSITTAVLNANKMIKEMDLDPNFKKAFPGIVGTVVSKWDKDNNPNSEPINKILKNRTISSLAIDAARELDMETLDKWLETQQQFVKRDSLKANQAPELPPKVAQRKERLMNRLANKISAPVKSVTKFIGNLGRNR